MVLKALPEIWDDLVKKAQDIQDGERRAGKPDSQGFVFQGGAYEGLTCDGLEWIYSFGGGTIADNEMPNNARRNSALRREVSATASSSSVVWAWPEFQSLALPLRLSSMVADREQSLTLSFVSY
jgi:hypothetical protein